MIKNDRTATALRSFHEMSESAYKMMEIENKYLKRFGSSSFDLDEANNPRQKFSKTYKPNGYVDVIVSSYVTKNHKIHGDKVLAYISEYVVEVDDTTDFDYLEYQIASNKLLYDRLFS